MRFHKLTLTISGVIAGAALLTLTGCSGSSSSSRNESSDSFDADSSSMVIPRHAKGFNVTYADGYTLLDITDPENKEKEKFHFALVPSGTDVDTPRATHASKHLLKAWCA